MAGRTIESLGLFINIMYDNNRKFCLMYPTAGDGIQIRNLYHHILTVKLAQTRKEESSIFPYFNKPPKAGYHNRKEVNIAALLGSQVCQWLLLNSGECLIQMTSQWQEKETSG